MSRDQLKNTVNNSLHQKPGVFTTVGLEYSNIAEAKEKNVKPTV